MIKPPPLSGFGSGTLQGSEPFALPTELSGRILVFRTFYYASATTEARAWWVIACCRRWQRNPNPRRALPRGPALLLWTYAALLSTFFPDSIAISNSYNPRSELEVKRNCMDWNRHNTPLCTSEVVSAHTDLYLSFEEKG